VPNFIKRKHPRKGEEKEQGAKTKKCRQANSPKEASHKGGKGTTKNPTLHQSHEAYQLKRGKVNLIKLQA
jgi:hypothetical protein